MVLNIFVVLGLVTKGLRIEINQDKFFYYIKTSQLFWLRQILLSGSYMMVTLTFIGLEENSEISRQSFTQ